MKYAHILLGLLLAVVTATAQDCVPATLKYFADGIGIIHPLDHWKAACKTDGTGTSISEIMPAWEKLTANVAILTPIYVVPKLDVPTIDNVMEPYRKIVVDKGIVVGYFKYLWVGMRKDPTTGSLSAHSGIVIFNESNVTMISPNSVTDDGKYVTETVDYRTLLLHTFLIFDLTVPVEQTAPRHPKVLL